MPTTIERISCKPPVLRISKRKRAGLGEYSASRKRSKTLRLAIAKGQNRAAQEAGHLGRAGWRSAPATAAQITALRIIAMETGRTFDIAVTRGTAWRRIKQATVTLDEQLRRRCAPPWYTAPSSSSKRMAA